MRASWALALLALGALVFIPHAVFSLPISQVEQSIMSELLNSFLDPRAVPDNWGTSPDHCLWTGVTCADTDASTSTITKLQVIAPLHFSYTGLVLLPSLGSLANLTELIISGYNLSGVLPDEWSQLRKLQVLQVINFPALVQNHVTGSIPLSYTTLSELQLLGLEMMQLGGTIHAEFGNLLQLKELKLENNNLTGEIPATLASLSNLRKLLLGSNRLSGPFPPFLSSMPSLKILRVEFNHLTGTIPEFNQSSPLTVLHMSRNRFEGPFPLSILNLQHLMSLNLSDNALTGELPSSFASLPDLIELNLGYNQFSGPIPTIFPPNLVTLDLSQNSLTGVIPAGIRTCTGLVTLALGSNPMSHQPLPDWLPELSGLKFLYFERIQLQGDFSIILNKIPTLSQIDLHGNALPCPTESLASPNITQCILHDNKLCPTHAYTPECSTIPLKCRVTPCRIDSQQNQEILLSDGISSCASGAIEMGYFANNSVKIDLSRCDLAYTVTARPPGATRDFQTSVRITSLSQELLREIQHEWSTSTLSWRISASNISSPNNPAVPVITYETTLPNGARFRMPFYFFSQPELENNTIKVYDRYLPLDAKTIKFGFEIENWNFDYRFGDDNSWFGVNMIVEFSEPFSFDLSAIQWVNALLANTPEQQPLNLVFPDVNAGASFRIAELGQTDRVNYVDIRLRVDPARMAEGQTGRLKSLELKFMFKVDRSLSYDPDLSLLFDSSLLLHPEASAAASSEMIAIGAGVGVAVAVVAIAASVTGFVLYRKRSFTLEQKRVNSLVSKQLQEQQQQPQKQHEQGWRAVHRPTVSSVALAT